MSEASKSALKAILSDARRAQYRDDGRGFSITIEQGDPVVAPTDAEDEDEAEEE